ncbi:MAG TPA: 4-alpha-glucanotransferase, partial [Terriglobales bacterium]|nr:4-alpha-glucanotransferase [Terriglobales bacterium]
MIFPRCSGILLHVTSLPGGHGIGDLGKSAYDFAQFLANSGQKIWQVLPLSPTGYGDSPYQCFSAFAGNPLLIDLTELQEQGLLSHEDFADGVDLPDGQVDYIAVSALKLGLLRKAAEKFFAFFQTSRDAFDIFCRTNADWLDDYALFMSCKAVYDGRSWMHWDQGIRRRDPVALNQWREKLSNDINLHKFAQFEFFRQWTKLKAHCNNLGLRIMGDLPIYVAHDSADVWAHPELFRLDEDSKPTAVAGVPPDYFSATGQLWGNPLYRWDRLAASGYKWWIDRFRASFKMFDMVRLDHFR